MSTVYALVDCNSFYASCERIFRPDLKDKPIGVLSNNDGCIVALSRELKALGIPRGTPAFKIEHLIEKHNITLFSSNYTLYGDISDRVMKTLAQFAPEIEIYSIDEAFLNLTNMLCDDYWEYGREIKNTIARWTGIPVSVGIGPTKTLAKLANHVAKKYKKFDGVFNIVNHPKKDKILESIPVNNVWGIGRRHTKRLNEMGVMNALQFSELPEKWVKQKMSLIGVRTMKELRGISCIDMDLIHDPKNIVSSKSFGHPVTTFEDMQEAISTYCITALEKLRRDASIAKTLTVFIQTNPFKNSPQYFNYKTENLNTPSAYTPEFLRLSTKLLKKIFKTGYSYKKGGVMIGGIMPEGEVPLDLLSQHILTIDGKK